MILLLVSTHAPLIRHACQQADDDAHTLITAGTVADAIKACKLHQPAMILLDITSVDGTFFVDKLDELYRHRILPTLIILSQTAQPADAILAFGIGGFVRYDDAHLPPLSSLITHAQRPTLAQMPPHQPAIIVRSHRGDERIFIDDIWYCQAEHKYTKIHHRHGITLTDDTLKSLEAAHPDALVRIHRHTLVGIRHIKQICTQPSPSHDDDDKDGLAQDKYQLLLHPVATPLAISRRCLPTLRVKLANPSTTPPHP